MQRFAILLQCFFWIAVAYLPLAIDREVTEFMVNQNCMPGSECLTLAMPLIVQIGLVGWAARMLLWPIAFWHLGGSWLWQNFRPGRSVKATS